MSELTKDEMRLDWIARQGDEFSSGIIQDRPGDGDYYVLGCGNSQGQGRTFVEALDAAMYGYETPAHRARR